MEAADRTGLFHAPQAFQDVKKAQAVLGQIRDTHLLRNGLDDWLAGERDSDAARTLVGVLDAEIQRRQQEFLRVRDAMADATRFYERRFSRPARPGAAPFLMMSAAVPGILIISTELARRADARDD
jgi:hypothetical protein